MSNIRLITPPDILYDKSFKISLFFCSDQIKTEVQNHVANFTQDLDIYLCDDITNIFYDWLLAVHKMSDVCVLYLDFLPPAYKILESYLISFSNTYWITQGEIPVYNKLSNNRIYSINQISKIMGDEIEIL